MKGIKLHNTEFKPYISNRIIQRAVGHMAEDITRDLGKQNPLFLAVLNGSFIFAADLMRSLDFNCNISFVKLESYSGTKSKGTVKSLIGLNENIKNRTVVIVEDIVDSGNTIEMLVAELKKYKPTSVHVATLFFKPDVYKKKIRIDYRGIEIPNDFIVGYGLDYDGLGRNLKDVYIINSKK